MAYEKQTWVNGETITQEKLNHMEDGIEDAYELPAVTETDNGKVLGVENGAWSVVNGGGGVLFVNATKTSSSENTYILDKTWQEIHDAFLSIPVIIHHISDDSDGYMTVTAVADRRPENGVVVHAGSATFLADNATDYPESFR